VRGFRRGLTNRVIALPAPPPLAFELSVKPFLRFANINVLKDKDLEFANSIREGFETG
jgi:hypothetical protein